MRRGDASFKYTLNKCTVGQKKKKKKGKPPSNFNTNNHRERKCIPINMDWSLHSFNAFEFSLGGRLHGWSLSNFNFFRCKPENLTTQW